MAETRGFIYVLREREFIRLDEPVYKVGRSCDYARRANDYPSGSEVISVSAVSDMFVAETELKARCEQEFRRRSEYGLEYFECDISRLMAIFAEVAFAYRLESTVDQNIVAPVRDTDLLIIEYVDAHRQELSSTVFKATEFIARFNDHVERRGSRPLQLQIIAGRLRSLYRTMYEPAMFSDGLSPAICFPNLLYNAEEATPMDLITNRLRNFLREHVVLGVTQFEMVRGLPPFVKRTAVLKAFRNAFPSCDAIQHIESKKLKNIIDEIMAEAGYTFVSQKRVGNTICKDGYHGAALAINVLESE
jgi:hypothetical protein